jgi:hypothetical protein
VKTNVYKEVITSGTKSWNRTKIMLMGEGRAGKTCLGQALLGKPFKITPSTEALDTLSASIRIYTSQAVCTWEERQPSTVLEEAVIAMAEDIPLSPPPWRLGYWQRSKGHCLDWNRCDRITCRSGLRIHLSLMLLPS